MARAAARILVHDVHQLADAVLAVAQHLGRVAPGGCHQLVAHHQHAKVVAGQARDGDVIQADLGQRRAMARAAARILVDDVHQLADAVLAVAQHLRRVAPRGRHQLVAHHQHAKVVAGQKALDHHLVAEALRGGKGGLQLRARGDVHRHALALVAVLGLDDHGQADFLGHCPGVIHIGHRPAHGHGHAGGVQQALGQVLVLGDGFGHGAGQIQLRRLDAPRLAAPAQLHQRAAGQAPKRYAARHGGVDDGAGGRPDAVVLVEFAQLGDHGVGVEGRVGQRGLQQLFGALHGQAADRFLGVFDDHLEGALFDGRMRAAEGHRATGLGLQRQGCSLQHIGQRHALARALGLQGADLRKARAQPVFKAGQLADVVLLGRALHYGLDGGAAGPEVGAAQGADAGDLHGCSFSRILIQIGA